MHKILKFHVKWHLMQISKNYTRYINRSVRKSGHLRDNWQYKETFYFKAKTKYPYTNDPAQIALITNNLGHISIYETIYL